MFCVSRSARAGKLSKLKHSFAYIIKEQLCACSTSTDAQAEIKTKTAYTATLDEKTKELFASGEVKHRKHPGVRHQKSVQMPTLLERAASQIISRYNRSQFKDDVQRMFDRVHHHQLPTEEDELQRARLEITAGQTLKDEEAMSQATTAEELNEIARKRQQRIEKELNKKFYHWKSIEYDEYAAVVYMAARLPANYAALTAVLQEIRKEDQDFQPKTMFDFGSGVGTSMWVANSIWPKSLTEHFNVDMSEHMSDLSRLLLQSGDESNPLQFPGVFYRQFLPVSHNIKYDLVISAFSLLELPNAASRNHVVENLWNKTQDILVFVEHGTVNGFAAILEARNFVLEKSGYGVTKSYTNEPENRDVQSTTPDNDATAHIVAPCPHHLPCPRLFTGGPVLCNNEVPYFPLKLEGQEPNVQKEKYTYIILRKGPRPPNDSYRWPRIVEHPHKNKGHVFCKMCCPDGKIRPIIFTKSKHKGDLYRIAKAIEWGDKMPVTVIDFQKPVREKKKKKSEETKE